MWVVLSYRSHVQNGSVLRPTVLVFVFITELRRGALDEPERLQHGGRVRQIGFTATHGPHIRSLCSEPFKVLRVVWYLTMPLSFSEDGSVPFTKGSALLSDGLSLEPPVRPSRTLTRWDFTSRMVSVYPTSCRYLRHESEVSLGPFVVLTRVQVQHVSSALR